MHEVHTQLKQTCLTINRSIKAAVHKDGTMAMNDISNSAGTAKFADMLRRASSVEVFVKTDSVDSW